MYTSGICFYEIEEEVEMHIMKRKRTRKMGTRRQKAMTNPYISFTMNYDFTRQLKS